MNPRTLRFLADNRIYFILAIALLLCLMFVPDLRSAPALKNLLVRASIDGLMAIGVTVVILSGQLDLSVGAVLALAGVVAIGLQEPLGPIPGRGGRGRRRWTGRGHEWVPRRQGRRQLVHRDACGHDRRYAGSR